MSATASASALPRSTLRSTLVHAGLWFVVIAWGGSFVAARLLLHAEAPDAAALSPTVLAALRFSLASLVFLFPLAQAIRRRTITARDILRLAILGQITYGLYFWLQYTGVQLTSAGISSILVVGLIPVATAFLSQFLGGERLSARTFAALLLGFAGVAVIVAQQQLQFARQSGFLFGALCLIGDAFAFAVYSNLSKRWMRGISPLVMTGGTLLAGALGLVLLSLTDPAHNQWVNVTRLDARQWIAVLFLALVCSVAAYFVYNVALTQVPASRAAVYIYFEPVVAVVLGALLLGERLTGQTILGALIIAAAVAAVALGRR